MSTDYIGKLCTSMQELQDRAIRARSEAFDLTPVQVAAVDAWLAELGPCAPTAIGGRLEYRFAPTSIGTFVSVHDCVTNRVLDLNDYENF